MPGELEHRAALERSRAGINVADATWNAIARFADELGVASPRVPAPSGNGNGQTRPLESRVANR